MELPIPRQRRVRRVLARVGSQNASWPQLAGTQVGQGGVARLATDLYVAKRQLIAAVPRHRADFQRRY
ncbi:MAG TPA: hypothetical protein DDW52_08805 [Planctomycetaceae bacterium]|nr:hypothetical protein [Planctomycetaceae bacterium]